MTSANTIDTTKFKGIITAIVTPMHEDGAVDFQSLGSLIEHQLQLGVKGFYVGGSTGEGFILTSEERMQVLEVVVRTNRGRGTIISHIGCISTEETIKLAKHAEQLGVDAISAVVPFYYKLSLGDIQRHYEQIMASVSLPLIVYHFPGATGVNLTIDFYKAMAEHPQCIGVKFTSMNLFEMQQIRSICGKDFLIFNGHDEVYAAGALMGADGAIGSTFNIMASAFVQLHQDAAAGRWQLLRAQQELVNEIIVDLINYDVFPYEKYVLYLQGVIASPAIRQPLKQLTQEEKAKIEAFYHNNPILKHDVKVK